MAATHRAISWTEQGLVPDTVIRHGIRRLLKARLESLPHGVEVQAEARSAFIRNMDTQVIAPLPDKPNEQHYELPAEFFAGVLGSQRKYSCGYWPEGVTDLDQAEETALRITAERAGLNDGMQILELGCGWGSLTLWMARHFPASRIVAVSNATPQRRYIEAQAKRGGLTNIEVVTCDMNEFDTHLRFDRVVSVEMFEHMRNYRLLLRRIASWLTPGGRLFLHIFCHRAVPYAFLDRGTGDWMSRHFFSGGMMPSDDLPLHFQQDLHLREHWRWNGRHYRDTANAWLANMDRHRDQLWPVLEGVYGAQFTRQWWMRWRMFFMACAELFGYEDGRQWWVSHYLFEKPANAATIRAT
ncbi:MAG: cyclopropane-fatty-acyl-phospholipid synthase family protein [Thiogranum sp.]|jgi:cyclopropane-fatty-acyl-phospholipid synthase